MNSQLVCLIGLLTRTSERRLKRIRKIFDKEYGTPVKDEIGTKTQGTFKDILMAIVDEERDPSNKIDPRKAQRDAEVS